MENRLSKEEVDILISATRRGLALPEHERDSYADNARALLAMADQFIQTCELLAQCCVDELGKYDNNIDAAWKDAVTEEILWWWGWTLKLRNEGVLQNWENFKKAEFPYERFLDQMTGMAPIRVLNIGSGPRSVMGEASSATSLQFTKMDPLAPAYNPLMALLDAPGTGDIVFGAVEILSQLDLPRFNFISARNCLDHAYDVPNGLNEMIKALSDQGLIELVHYENEGLAQNYLGMHKWNIEIADSRVHIWNRDEEVHFDHEKYGLDLHYRRESVTKGTGQQHNSVTIWLSRGLENVELDAT